MKKLLTFAVIAALILSFATSTFSQDIYYGSEDTETVMTIQDKLRRWGYYEGRVDGGFGWMTEEAIMYFQRANGLSVTGRADEKTLNAMGIFPSGGGSSGGSSGGESSGGYNGYSQNDVMLLASCINGEARGESYEGQVAVAAVILNRVDDPNFPNSISGVVYQGGAFDAVADGQINLSPKDSCISAAKDALNGWDPTGGAIYYYNPATATNKWIRSREIIRVIGNHVFCL